MRRSISPWKMPGAWFEWEALEELPWRERWAAHERAPPTGSRMTAVPWAMEYRLGDSVSLAEGRIMERMLWSQDEVFPCSRKAVQSCWCSDGSLGLLVMPMW